MERGLCSNLLSYHVTDAKERLEKYLKGGKFKKKTVVLRRWGVLIRSDKGLMLKTSASECLYGGQFTLSTQLLKPNYLKQYLLSLQSWTEY